MTPSIFASALRATAARLQTESALATSIARSIALRANSSMCSILAEELEAEDAKLKELRRNDPSR